MQDHYKKYIGKIYTFDGEAGTIITLDNKYHFHKKDLLNKELKEGSIVEFVPNTNVFGPDKDLVALYINNVNKTEKDELIRKYIKRD